VRKILNLTILISLLSALFLNSCRQEIESSKVHNAENLSAKNLTAKVYQKRSPFKADTILIKIMQKTFLNHADISHFEKKYGKLYWDYAISLENDEHHSVLIPIIKENVVISTMHAVLKNNKVFFNEKKDKKLIMFFDKLVFSKITTFQETNNNSNQNSKIIATNCKTMTFTVGCPPGYSDCQDISYSVTSCDYMDDGTGFPSSGNPYQMEICPESACGGGGGSGYNPEFDMPYVLGPEVKITDIKSFLKCINASLGAKLTVYCKQPIANSSASHDGTYVGHSFISIQQGNQVKVIGFYPVSDYINPLNPSGNGVYGNDSNEEFNTSISINISPSKLYQILQYIYNTQNANYNLNTFNCTDFAINVGNLGGLNLPDGYGTWPGGGGSNPGALGQYIRSLSGSINSNSGINAPSSTNCN